MNSPLKERSRTREMIKRIEDRRKRGKERLAELIGEEQAAEMIEEVREAELVESDFDTAAIDSFVCPGNDEFAAWDELERIISIHHREAQRNGLKLKLKLTPVDVH